MIILKSLSTYRLKKCLIGRNGKISWKGCWREVFFLTGKLGIKKIIMLKMHITKKAFP